MNGSQGSTGLFLDDGTQWCQRADAALPWVSLRKPRPGEEIGLQVRADEATNPCILMDSNSEAHPLVRSFIHSFIQCCMHCMPSLALSTSRSSLCRRWEGVSASQTRPNHRKLTSSGGRQVRSKEKHNARCSQTAKGQ